MSRRKEREAKERARQEARIRRRNQKLHRALRDGKFDDSTNTYEVRFEGEVHRVSEKEYLWLLIRGHLQTWPSCTQLPASITESRYIQPSPTTGDTSCTTGSK